MKNFVGEEALSWFKTEALGTMSKVLDVNQRFFVFQGSGGCDQPNGCWALVFGPAKHTSVVDFLKTRFGAGRLVAECFDVHGGRGCGCLGWELVSESVGVLTGEGVVQDLAVIPSCDINEFFNNMNDNALNFVKGGVQ